MTRPRLAEVAFQFLRIGNLTFGGGDPTMAAIYREFVNRRGWLSAENYGLVFSLARITPGTNLLAFCAGIGWRLAGSAGALLAVLAVTLPSAVLTVWLTHIYATLGTHPWTGVAIRGTLAGAVGMMAAAALLLVRPSFTRARWPKAVLLPGLAFFLVQAAGVNPLLVLAGGAAAGALWRERETA